MRRYILIITSSFLIIGIATTFAAPFDENNIDENLVTNVLHGGAVTVGLVGSFLETQFNTNVPVMSELRRLLSLLDKMKAMEMEKTVSRFGDFFDDLSQQRIVLLQETIQKMLRQEIHGDTIDAFTKNAAVALSNLENDLVLTLDARDVVNKLATASLLGTPYGTMLGKTADGSAVGIATIGNMTEVLLMIDNEIFYEAPIVAGIARVPLHTLNQLFDLSDGENVALNIVYRLNDKVPAFVLPVESSPLTDVQFASIDTLVAALHDAGMGLGTLVNMLAANGRSCVVLGDGATSPQAAMIEPSFLGSVMDTVRSLLQRLLDMFSASVTRAASEDMLLCGAIGERGNEIARTINVLYPNASAHTTLQMNGEDIETVIDGDVLIGRVPESVRSGITSQVDVVEYPSYTVTVSGTDFGTDPIVKINGEILATQFIVQNGNNLTLDIPLSMRRTNPNIVSITHAVSKKVATSELYIPSSNKPITKQTKERVINAALNSGISVLLQLPQDQGALFEYLLKTWKVVVYAQ